MSWIGKNFWQGQRFSHEILALRGYIVFFFYILSLCSFISESPSQCRIFQVYSFATRKLIYFDTISISVKIWNPTGASVRFSPAESKTVRNKSSFSCASRRRMLGVLCWEAASLSGAAVCGIQACRTLAVCSQASEGVCAGDEDPAEVEKCICPRSQVLKMETKDLINVPQTCSVYFLADRESSCLKNVLVPSPKDASKANIRRQESCC